jgi:hypothetical protein
MKSYPTKPVYTPKQKVASGQFTKGKEYMTAETYIEYTGPYHIYPNGAIYSGGGFTDESIHLIPYAKALEPSELINAPDKDLSENNSIYFTLTSTRFNNHRKPQYYYPEVIQADYDTAFITRFFVQKINNKADITEIDADEFDAVNSANKVGIDAGLYKKLKLNWSISGRLEDVQKVNRKVLQSKEKDLPGIKEYLTDLDEFHKDRHLIKDDAISNLHTSGGEYILPNGQDYIGLYHIHPTYGPMELPAHTKTPHRRLTKITAK